MFCKKDERDIEMKIKIDQNGMWYGCDYLGTVLETHFGTQI